MDLGVTHRASTNMVGADTLRPTWFEVTTQWQMVSSVLRWNPTMIPPDLIGSKTVTRSHCLTFFVVGDLWRELRSKELKVTRMLTHVGKSSFKQYAVVTHNGIPVFSITTTVVAVDDTLARSIPLPRADTMCAAMASQAPRAARIRAMPWPAAAAPGAGSEHGERVPRRAPRPPDAFRWGTCARWVECDEYGHMSQSQYALLMEEARAVAAVAGAYGGGAVAAAAGRSPARFDVEYVGQARAGEALSVFTWWDSESFRCEVEKDAVDAGQGELLTLGRLWVADADVPRLDSKL